VSVCSITDLISDPAAKSFDWGGSAPMYTFEQRDPERSRPFASHKARGVVYRATPLS
jgi:hypothetical protein